MAEQDRHSGATGYCAELVRRHDPDRYLTALFAPKARRADLLALYAFNLEVAKTAEVVSEPLLGEMRLQWWLDAIEAAYDGRPPEHEVALPLAAAIRRRGLSRGHFTRLIEARRFDLDATAPVDLAALEDYAERTSAALLHLGLEALDAQGEAAAVAARHVGIAWALTGLLRAVPFHARHKRIYLPRDLSETAGLALGDLFELRSSPALASVVGQVAARAREHLREARGLRDQVPPRARPVLLSATLASRALASLDKARYDPFAPSLQTEAPARAWRLWWANLRGRY